MSNPFNDMENMWQEDHQIRIDWEKLPNERSIEVPWLLNKLDTVKPKAVLDVGFAGSFYQEDILDKGIDYIGLDFDMSRITGQSLHVDNLQKESWRQLIKKFKWHQGDIVNLPEEIKRERFDMVICISTIEHIVPAGYASNYTDFHADLTAVANMKSLIGEDGSLLLTFPVGKTAYFYNPKVNRNAKALEGTNVFQKGVHDQMFYDADRIAQIVGDWDIIEKTFYVRTDMGEWLQHTEEIATSVVHLTSEASTVCLLHIKRRS